MYGLVYIEEPINVGSTDLICPKAIHAIKVDTDKSILVRKYYEFKPLNISNGIDEAYQEVLSDWRKICREFNADFSDAENLVFIDGVQYSSFFYARGKSKGWMNIRECFILPQKYKKNTKFTCVGKSGAENVWNMYQIFKRMPNEKLESAKRTKKKNHSIRILHKRTSVSFLNEHTGFITKQIKNMCDELGMEIIEENGIVKVYTMAGDWKFNALARPTILSKRNVGRLNDEEYHVEKEGIYSPLEAIKFIKQRDDNELAKRLDEIPKLELEESYQWI